MIEDRNFDDIAQKFAKNIYGSTKGDIRQRIVWQDIENLLNEFNTTTKLKVLDAGGGLAQFSMQLAALGHRVALCDISNEMLHIAKQNIQQAGLAEQFEFIHAPVQKINQYHESCDLLLFHAVMEWLAEPHAALKQVLSQVKSSGIASIMFYNQNGLLFKNLICGNLTHIEQGMPYRKRFKLQPQRGLMPDEVYQWIENEGFEILGKSGVRTFYDYMKDTRVGEFTQEQVIEMEQKLCRTEPFVSLGRYIHVWAKRKHK